MKRLALIAIAAVFMLQSVALAQTDAPSISFDLTAIFASTGALALFSITLIGFIREKVWKTLDGMTLTGVVFVTNIALAIAGFYMGALTAAADLYAALGFGVGAGIAAIGIVSQAYRVAAKGQNPAGKLGE